MIHLLRGQTTRREGRLLTENEYRKLTETIYIPELDKTLSKDEVLKHYRQSGALKKAEKGMDILEKIVNRLVKVKQ